MEIYTNFHSINYYGISHKIHVHSSSGTIASGGVHRAGFARAARSERTTVPTSRDSDRYDHIMIAYFECFAHHHLLPSCICTLRQACGLPVVGILGMLQLVQHQISTSVREPWSQPGKRLAFKYTCLNSYQRPFAPHVLCRFRHLTAIILPRSLACQSRP